MPNKAHHPDRTVPTQNRFEDVLDDWGRRIVAGKYAPGDTLRLEDIQRKYGASRTLVRDAAGTLEAAGLVRTSRRVGITVEPESCWSHLDPRVLRWQLEDPHARRGRLLRLSELRYAVEPVAASLMAAISTPEERSRLVLDAERLAHLAGGSSHEFLEADLAFHARVLHGSGNDLFAEFEPGISAAIRGRVEHELMPAPADPDAVELHVQAAHAVFHGRSAQASDVIRQLLDEVIDRFATGYDRPSDS